ncbi:MAG: hypothetical protein PVH21_12185 [Myxococcales bacterium]|jgi:hypothetical protein
MLRRFACISCFLVFTVLGGGAASADDVPSSEGAAATEPSHELSYEEYRLKQLHYLAGRSRKGLIASSAVMAAGVALVTPAFVTDCVRVASSSSFDDLRCTTRGKALLGVGIPILLGGTLSLLITGLMFGVRKGRIRATEDQLEYERRRAVRWDPARGAFAF